MSVSLTDPGSIRLRLSWDGTHGHVDALEIVRPTATAALVGKSADQAVRMVPLLYSLCGAAQGIAAELALRAARGMAQAPMIAASVLAEARREHLWRLLLDWPRALGLPGDEALMVEGRRRLQADDFPRWGEKALREPLAALEHTLLAQAEPRTRGDERLLPSLSALESLSLWPRLDEAFAAQPSYGGLAAETGALARHPELVGVAPILARVRARMADLATGGTLGRVSAVTVAAGIGRAAVETARGLLLHEVVLNGDRIVAYVIVAPTEWNFHESGPLRTWLDGAAMPTLADLEALARRAVLALDPCVAANINIIAKLAA